MSAGRKSAGASAAIRTPVAMIFRNSNPAQTGQSVAAGNPNSSEVASSRLNHLEQANFAEAPVSSTAALNIPSIEKPVRGPGRQKKVPRAALPPSSWAPSAHSAQSAAMPGNGRGRGTTV